MTQDRIEPGPETGVLLVNLGTPAAPTPAAVRRYLAEFLGDRRVVDYPRALWLPLLHGVILNTRPARSARAYASIWRAESDESPLRYYTRRQAEELAGALAVAAQVDWAMRYGAPSIQERLESLVARGAKAVLVVALYPQYSTTTTLSVADAVAKAAGRIAGKADFRLAPAFFDHPGYIEALARRTEAALARMDRAPERVVISFHGTPARLVEQGDPYRDQCLATARLLRERMGWSEDFAPVAWQSRFGPEKWFAPSTEEMIVGMAQAGVRRAGLIAPGFFSDCLETLEELAIGVREKFEAAGGEHLEVIDCLNDSPEAVAFLKDFAEQSLRNSPAQTRSFDV